MEACSAGCGAEGARRAAVFFAALLGVVDVAKCCPYGGSSWLHNTPTPFSMSWFVPFAAAGIYPALGAWPNWAKLGFFCPFPVAVQLRLR